MNENLLELQGIFCHRRVALVTHVRPDGDALGSLYALYTVFKRLGAAADCLCDSPLPDFLAFLDRDGVFNQKTLPAYDAAIAVDCASLERMGAHAAVFLNAPKRYCIDHHGTNRGFGDVSYVRESGSAAELVYDLMVAEGITLDKEVATAVYSGLITDTGSFSQSNTTAHTHETAAKLLSLGIDVEGLHNRLLKERTRARLDFTVECVRAMRFFENDRIALITVSEEALRRFGLAGSDTEGLVNIALNIVGVVIGICMTEDGRNHYKVSFRSKAGVDVAAVAEQFGGGGHLQAAGCAVQGLLEASLEKIVRECGFVLP